MVGASVTSTFKLQTYPVIHKEVLLINYSDWYLDEGSENAFMCMV